VAQRRGDPAGLVELDELGVQVGRRGEGEHRALAADDDDGVEGVDVDPVDGGGVVDQLDELGFVEVAPADDVFALPSAGVFGVGHRVGLTPAAVGAEDLDLVPDLGEPEVGVVNSDHQKPTGQPVVADTAGLEITLATRFGRPGLTTLTAL
jgi:hypothetical protein